MRKISKFIVPALLTSALPFVTAGVANASDPTNNSGPASISACTLSPATASLAAGQTVDVTFGWSDINGGTAPGTDVVYAERQVNSDPVMGFVAPMNITNSSNPLTIPYTFSQLSTDLNGAAGTVTYRFYATDGTAKLGSTLCSISFSVAAAPATTTTTVAPVTLPHTGSNTGALVAGGMTIMALGGALYISGRRRSIK